MAFDPNVLSERLPSKPEARPPRVRPFGRKCEKNPSGSGRSSTT